MPTELTLVAVTALLAGLLLMGIMMSGGRFHASSANVVIAERTSPRPDNSPDVADREAGADPVRRVVWWLTISVVMLGVGITGSFPTLQAHTDG